MNNDEIVAWIKKIETRIDRLMIRGTTSTIAPAPGTWVEFLNVGSPSTSATYGEVHASGGFVFGALSYITAGGLVVTGGLGVTGGASITGGLNVGSATGAASGQVKASAGLDLAGSKFVVDSSGNLTAVNNVAYSWPAAQGGATTYLTNNGSGTLTWGSTTTPAAHDIVTSHTYTGGAALDVFGLSGASTIAKLTPSSNPGGTAAILKTDASGYLQLVRLGLGVSPDDRLHVLGGHVILGPQAAGAGNTCQLQFRELAANGTNCVGFKSPDSIASDVIWTLPSADGSASYVLSTNGAGTLSWAAGAAPAAHNILSASHGDTAAGTVVRGDIIYGNSTPAWARLAVGAANAFLRTDGTDTGWSSFYLTGTSGGTTSLAVTNTKTLTLTAADSYNATFPASGTVAYGTGSTNTIPKWSGTNTLTYLANSAGYLYNDGAGTFSWASTAAATAHKLLSTTHSDTLAADVQRGDLLYGNSTPAWARLGKGSANAFIRTDGTDVAWSTGFLSVTAAKTLTVQNSLTLSGTDTKALTLTGSLTIGADTSITGGGTLALGGYTLTVPATGTAVLGTGGTNLMSYWSGTNTQTSLANGTGYLYNNGGGTFSWATSATPAAHNVLSASHGDTLADSVVRGDVLVGNSTPKWARYAISVPGAGLINYFGVATGESDPTWKTASNNPGAAAAVLASNSSGQLTLRGLTVDNAGTIIVDGEGGGVIVDTTSRRVGFMKYSGREAGIWRLSSQDFEIGRLDAGVTALPGSPSTWTVDLYIAGDGKVGINQPGPIYNLDVNGTFRANTTTPVFGSYTVTIPATGTISLGTGTQYQLAVWAGTNTVAGLGALGTAGQYLRSAGAGANPAWSTIPASEIGSGTALTRTDDTNVTLTLGGSPNTALLAATSLTLGWTGTLAAGRLNANVVQGITNDTNVTGSIATQTLTLGWTGTLAAGRLNANVVQGVTNDTNVTGSIATQTLTLGWTGTLAAGRLNANVVQAVTNDTNVTGSIATQTLTLGWTGQLAMARGGTGANLTNDPGGIVYCGASALAVLADGTSGYVLTSGGTGAPTWSATATGAAHALLSASHSDTLADSVARGDIIIGNSTPKWARLAKGAANTFLISDGTDPTWTKHIGGARCYRTTTQACGGGNTALSWDTEYSDTDGLWAAGSPTRFTIQTAGVYIAGGGAQMEDDGEEDVRFCLSVRVNGTTFYGTSQIFSLGGGGGHGGDQGPPCVLSVTSGHMVLAVNDYVEIILYNSSAYSLDAQAASSTNHGPNCGWIDRIA